MFNSLLVAVMILLGNMPIVDTLVDEACDLAGSMWCGGSGIPAVGAASASGPGFDIYVSDVKWDKSGVEEVNGAYSGVAFDVDIRITDEEAIPGAGVIAFSAVCVDADHKITRELDAGITSDLQVWDQSIEPNTLQAMAEDYAEGIRYAYVEITDLCATGERRGLLTFVSWADDVAAYGGDYHVGWAYGDNAAGPYDFGMGGLAYGEAGTLVALAHQDSCVGTFTGAYNIQPCWMENLEPYRFNWVFYRTNGTSAFGQSNMGGWDTFLSSVSNGSYLVGYTRNVSVTAPGLDRVEVTVLQSGSPIATLVWYPEGHPLRVDGAPEILGWSATLGMSDALDSVNFVPGAANSHIFELDGMCEEWADCQAFCDDYKSIGEIVSYLACLIDFPWPFPDVVSALRDDFMDAPAVAVARVVLLNVSTAYNAIGSISESCGSLGAMDFGIVGGSRDIDTCDIPAEWRSYMKTGFTVLVTVAGLMVCVNMLLRAAGLATLGEVAASASAKHAESQEPAVRRMWGPGK